MTTTSWDKRPLQYRLANNMRSRLNAAIKNKSKVGSSVRDLGCSIGYFIKYIEQQFQSGMTWENWSRDGWHLDHIIPLSSFNLTDRSQFLQACHYTNYQPLWASENYSKGSKVPINIVHKDIRLDHKTIVEEKVITHIGRNKYDVSEFENLLSQGLSLTSISKKVGCSVCKIRYWLDRLNLREKYNRGYKKNYCKKCGENDPNNFYNKKSICKKCFNKLTYEYQKIRRRK